MMEGTLPLAILTVSVLLQFSAAALALRLIRVTGRPLAWGLIALALVLMGGRRTITLFRVLSGDATLPPDVTAEVVALLISVLMVVGVALIGPLFQSIAREVAERKKAEKELERAVAEVSRSNEELRLSIEREHSIIEAALDAIISIDERGKVIEFSPSAGAIFGYDADEAKGKDIAGLIIPPALRETHREGLKRYIETGKSNVIGKRIELTAVGKTRSEFPVELTITTARNQEGHVFTAFVRDITERKKAEEALAARATELERINAELEQFAFVASHDLNEPLNSIEGYVNLLADRYREKLDEDANQYIGYTVEGVQHLKALIRDILAHSLITTRGGSFQRQSLQRVLDETLSELQETIEQRRVTITQDNLPSMDVDGSQVAMLFHNLIANAIKYAKEESPPIIHIGAEENGSEWMFSVSDNGIGIDPQHFDKIFLMFQRLHPQHSYSGTGVGLPICKRIVERHGGRIWVKSQPGEGSVFSFTLPTEQRP